MNAIVKNVTNNYLPTVLGSVILLALSLYRIVLADVWIDEASTLETVSLPLLDVWQRALVWEAQAPFYYLVQAAWMQVSTNLIFARLLPLIFTMSSIFMLDRIILLFESSTWKRTMMLVLVASAFYTIFAATTLRYFGLTLLFSTWLFYLFIKHYSNGDTVPPKTRILFTVLSVLSVLTQYYLGFLLFSFGVTLLITKRTKPFFSYCLDMIAPIAVLALIANSILMQVDTYSQINEGTPTYRQAIEFAIVHVENTIVACNWIQLSKVGRYGIRILYLLILALAVANRKKLPVFTSSLLWVALFSMLCLEGVYFLMQDNIVNFWHILFLFINVLILLFAALKAINLHIATLLASLIIVINLGSVVFFQKPNRELTKANLFIMDEASGHNQVVMYPNLYADMFKHHYQGKGSLKMFPVDIDYTEGFRLAQWAVQSPHQIDSFFQKNPQNKPFLFVEERISNLMNVDFNFDIIDL